MKTWTTQRRCETLWIVKLYRTTTMHTWKPIVILWHAFVKSTESSASSTSNSIARTFTHCQIWPRKLRICKAEVELLTGREHLNMIEGAVRVGISLYVQSTRWESLWQIKNIYQTMTPQNPENLVSAWTPITYTEASCRMKTPKVRFYAKYWYNNGCNTEMSWL